MAATRNAQTVKKETKEYITTAIMQILSKEKLGELTVSQVCRRAGVSRMAFYRNFNTLEQILHEYYQPEIAAIFATIRITSQDSVKLDTQSAFFNAFGDVLLLAIEHEFEPVIQQIFIEEMEKFYTANDDDYWIAFMSAGAYSIWRKWLTEGRKKPLSEIMNFLKKFDAVQYML